MLVEKRVRGAHLLFAAGAGGSKENTVGLKNAFAAKYRGSEKVTIINSIFKSYEKRSPR